VQAIRSNSESARAAGELPLLAALVLAQFAFRAAIDPFIGDTHQYVPAYVAIGAATWFFGWRVGAIAAAACLLSGEFFAPVGPLDGRVWHEAIAHVAYLFVAATLISFVEWRRREWDAAVTATAELRAMDRRKSEIMAHLGHELRDPLASIAMGGKMLAGGLDPAAARLTLRMLERQTQHLARLVGDLADVGCLQQGKLFLQREMVDVFAAVQEAMLAARAATEAKQQKVVLLRPQAVGAVYADAARLQQILCHLLQNASAFSPERTAIEVSLRASDHWVSISVEDAGIGIPPSDLPRVFEPFVQLGHSARPARGLGLGLAIARELAQLHGGSVRAFSAGIGRGCEFVLTLPTATPDLQPAADKRAQAVQTGRARSHVRRDPVVAAQRILVVDDNADAAATLALLLRLKGHEALVALDGRAALELAARKRPQLVFLDIGLPDMSGLDLATALREVLGPEPALVAITGWGSEKDQARSRAAGLDAHLTKPVDPAAIDQVLTLLGCAGQSSHA
jgi:signal transduction histidine kinase/ActR/RegA family two-component response regulator